MSGMGVEPPSGGLNLEDAIEAFTDTSLRERYREASDPLLPAAPSPGINWVRDGVLDSVDQRLGREHRDRVTAVNSAKKSAGQAIRANLCAKLLSGSLVAWGREGRPTGPWIEIPSDSFEVLRIDSVSKSTLEGPDGFKIFSTRVCRAVELSGIAGTAGAEAECRKQLEGLARVGDPVKAKREYFKDAKSLFGDKLGSNGFNRCWAHARDINPNWGKAGAKPKRPR